MIFTHVAVARLTSHESSPDEEALVVRCSSDDRSDDQNTVAEEHGPTSSKSVGKVAGGERANEGSDGVDTENNASFWAGVLQAEVADVCIRS